MKKPIVLLLLFFFFSSHPFIPAQETVSPKPKNVILVIGDGMGWGAVMLAYLYKNQVLGEKLEMERLMEEGEVAVAYSHPVNALVTDSASSATWMSSGVQTRLGHVGISPENQPVTTIAEQALESGKSIGIVTNTRLTHATPAVFLSHILDDRSGNWTRRWEREIAEQMIRPEEGTKILLGGGERMFQFENPRYSRKLTGEDFIKVAESAGYHVIKTRAELGGIGENEKVLGLFYDSHFPFVIDARADGIDIPSLSELFEASVPVLEKDPEGFFLMIESGRIDHAAHSNDTAALLWEMLALDELIGKALDYAKKKEDTLLIVTSDHETGGLGFASWTREKDGMRDHIYPTMKELRAVGAQKHSLDVILGRLFLASDVQAEKKILEEETGFLFSENQIRQALDSSVLSPFFIHEERAADIVNRLAALLAPKQGLAWSSATHTSTPFPLLAYGPGAERARGFHSVKKVYELMAE